MEKQFSKYITENYMKQFKGNKYLLVNVASQRARQINEGVEVYVKVKSRHPLDIALEEIRQGYIDFEIGAVREIEKPAVYDDMLAFEELIGLEEGFDMEDLDDDEASDLEAFAMDEDEDLYGVEDEEIISIDEVGEIPDEASADVFDDDLES